VKTLVKEIIVKPLPDPNPGKPAAEIHIHYMFPKDVTCTDKGSCNYLGNIVRSRRLPSGRGTEPTTDPFGARLRLLRLEAGLTIRRLANQADLSETALSAIEHGRATPSLPTLRKLSSVLGVGIADLAGYNDLPEKTLAQRICKARLCAGLTRVQLAKILSVDESSLCNWELGRRNPSNKKTRDAIEFFIRATLNVST
jgi:transcriptional regulator with XRE-family HTH domain